MRLRPILALALGGCLGAGSAAAQGLSVTYRGYNPAADVFCLTVQLRTGQLSALGDLVRVSPNPQTAVGNFNLPLANGSTRSEFFFIRPSAPNSTDVFVATIRAGNPPGGGSGTATGNTNRPNECTQFPPELVPPDAVPPGTGGGSVEGVQRNLQRLVGGALFERGYQISELIGFGFIRGPGTQRASLPYQVAQASGLPSLRQDETYPDTGEAWRWNAWALPRYLRLTDSRSGREATGDFGEVMAGVDYRISDSLIVGLAGGGEGLDGGINDTAFKVDYRGYYVGPYVGWKIRPTTVFDAWVGYAGISTDLSVPVERANYDSQRFFVSLNIAEIVTTSWGRVVPRLRYFWSRDWADGFTSNTGVRYGADSWNYSFVEATAETATKVALGQAVLYP